MKFGQAMSVFEAALPETLAGPYRETLTRLQESAPPLPARTVHLVLAHELGAGLARPVRESFDDTPAAAASIGQVHRAVWADGRDVAVKVQYPGAGDALLSDLTQIGRMSRLVGMLVPGLDVKPLVAELKARVAEELDYRLEAASQTAFADAFDGDPDVLVPRSSRAASKVLVSEWVDGTPAVAQVIAVRDARAARPRRPAAGALPVLRPAAGRAAARRPAPRQLPAARRRPARRSSTTARSTGCRTGCRRRSARCSSWRSPATPPGCFDGLRREGFVRAGHQPRRPGPARLPRADPRAGPRRDLPLLPGLAAQPGGAGRRPALPGLQHRAAAQPAAGLPADPPGHDRGHRRALPARGRGRRGGPSCETWLPGFGPDQPAPDLPGAPPRSGQRRGRQRRRAGPAPRAASAG